MPHRDMVSFARKRDRMSRLYERLYCISMFKLIVKSAVTCHAVFCDATLRKSQLDMDLGISYLSRDRIYNVSTIIIYRRTVIDQFSIKEAIDKLYGTSLPKACEKVLVRNTSRTSGSAIDWVVQRQSDEVGRQQ